MFQKGIFWTIGEHLYIYNCSVISYQRIKVYKVETMDMGRFCWNNGISGKCNHSKYFGIYCTG